MTKPGLAGSLAQAFIDSKLTPLIMGASILLGVGAVLMLPREEEPQIIVPMVDIFVGMPGASAGEVEERVTKPMEKLLWEIPGVEYIYSTSSPGAAMAVVRFYVGENEEDAIVRLNQKMFANFDLIPPGATPPLIKPRSIDDVPILALTLWSDHYDHSMLRRVAAQIHDPVKQVTDVSEVKMIGGLRRQLRVILDKAKMSAHQVAPTAIAAILQRTNRQIHSGRFAQRDREFLVETGGFLRNAEEVGSVVVGVSHHHPVYLRDVARIEDGTEEPDQYVLFGLGPAARYSHSLRPGSEAPGTISPEVDLPASSSLFPAVTLSVAKRKGANAIVVADAVLAKVEELPSSVLPSDIHVQVTRNYGKTAEEKSNELLFHMALAILSVSVLIWLALGLRESGIVAVAIPVTLALTLVVFYFYGYTLNRVTLFALIFSIGILVDDAIVVVENIARHYRLPENRERPLTQVAVEAVAEVGNPTILATLTVIAAILPMAFVTGLMGPYMRPIPVGASAAMFFSLLVSFLVTPWASLRLLVRREGRVSSEQEQGEDWTTRLYRRVMSPLLERGLPRYCFLGGTLLLLLSALSLLAFKRVTVKTLPFDNKSEFQVVIDMPEGTTLEATAATAQEIGGYLGTVPEVTDYQIYAGTASPFNFNGLVRHYFLRHQPFQADIQVNLTSRDLRRRPSHEIARQLRPAIQEIAKRHGAAVKMAEVPPGPPVLQTLVAEVYGPDYNQQMELARRIQKIFEQTEGIVDVDSYLEADQLKYHFEVDREKAALDGISAQQITSTVRLALQGLQVGPLHQPREREDVGIFLRLPEAGRSGVDRLQQVKVRGQAGNLVSLGELIDITQVVEDKSIYHKNLLPVVYVTGDVAGKEESPVYAIQKLSRQVDQLEFPPGDRIEQYTARQPFSEARFALKWDGEWHITYEVFRDLGIASQPFSF
ncbi:MAG: efflux RND transporter permease subunit [Acidobacteriota bacterium]